MLTTIGFILLTVMFAAYVVLDGYDLGIAAVSPFVAKSGADRGALMHAIGPFWNGNEVWLIAAGGTLFGLFPKAFAVSFSGFYLPLIIVLWLLMFRGISIELRATIDSDVWRTFWDALFTLSSALLAVLLGVALGNLIRGVDLDQSGYFMGTFSAMLSPFPVGAGIFALAALALHGLLYAGMRIEGPLGERCTALARRLWWAVLVLFVAMTAAAFALYHQADVHPVLSGALTLLALVALIALRRTVAQPRTAFYCSSTFLALLILAAAATLFPYLIPAYPRGSGGLTVYEGGPGSAPALAPFLLIIVVALVALLGYRWVVASRLSQRISVERDTEY